MQFLLVLLLLAQQQPAPTPQEKQVRALVSRIRRLAAAEPVVYSIDSRIKAADILTPRYPALALDIARDARDELTGVTFAADRNNLRVRLVHTFAALDLPEAERITGSFSRSGDNDYLARAYDQIYLVHPTREIISDGFAAGAFRMMSASRFLEEQKRSDPEAAVALFSELIASFPVESPEPDDVLFLLREARSAAVWNLALALEAIDKALTGADSVPTPARTKLMGDAAVILASIDPDLLKRYRISRKDLEISPPSDEKQPAQEKDPYAVAEELQKLPFADALASARRLSDLSAKTLAFIGLSRREEITAHQRTSMASEAFLIAGQIPMGEERLFLIAMISRDYARRGEMSSAALAAQLLLETYGKICDCQQASCEFRKVKIDCLERVDDFAEYLDEFKITPESMNLANISLDVRLLVLQLKGLVSLK